MLCWVLGGVVNKDRIMSIHPKLPVPPVPGFEYFTPVPAARRPALKPAPFAKLSPSLAALEQMYGYYQPAED